MRTLDADRLLKRFQVGPLTVKRKATGTFTKGNYTPSGSETTLTVTGCSLQPMRPRELQLLPEGFRTREAVKLYSPVQLRTADAVAGEEADRFEYKGKNYEVHSVENWDDHGGYWRAVALKMGQ